ncbi:MULTISPECIES: recombinase family protein [unclassified Leifsonia]|uniref:recombinase family protein n=1 Tax=unclassified Leifsonia TaxID=2663824 RepID=UPI0006FB4A5A|nr:MULTISPECIES: recombinase family protein [unclassified Leifsonia]KQX07190.1 hypothetical protein ASC59_05180 [Leifsonia sp. Root1293]KRA11473.1 hypothetical protein ASD61_05180 [Leifsonia sp. Root60]
MTTRAAVYLRISRDDQATGLAVERQRADCLAIITARGWELVGEYVDNAVSASKRTTKRPDYDRMVAAYEAGAFEALVCYDLDRLTRQPRQLEDWIDAAEERGLVLVTASGEADLATDNGRMFARMKATIARAEIERKGARQRRANLQRIESGKPAPGRRRYGYELDGVNPRPAEAAVVRRMFEHVAAGGSLRSIARALEDEAVDPAPGRSWSTGRIRYILKNPTYSGEVHSFGSALPSDVLVPIIERTLAEEVRAILADESRLTTPGPAPRHLGSGLASCGVCGGLMFNLAKAYRCKADSAHPTITKERLDTRLRGEVALAFLASGGSLSEERSDTTVAPLVAALEKNDRAARATAEDRDEGLLSPKAARARLIELRVERVAIEQRLSSARVERSASSVLADVAHELLAGDDMTPAKFFGDMTAAVAARFETLDLDRQRDTVRALLDVTVNPGRDPRRVVVWHKVVTKLNPESALAVDIVGEGESRGPGDRSNRRPARATV